jgi:hypothetical protein
VARPPVSFSGRRPSERPRTCATKPALASPDVTWRRAPNPPRASLLRPAPACHPHLRAKAARCPVMWFLIPPAPSPALTVSSLHHRPSRGLPAASPAARPDSSTVLLRFAVVPARPTSSLPGDCPAFEFCTASPTPFQTPCSMTLGARGLERGGGLRPRTRNGFGRNQLGTHADGRAVATALRRSTTRWSDFQRRAQPPPPHKCPWNTLLGLWHGQAWASSRGACQLEGLLRLDSSRALVLAGAQGESPAVRTAPFSGKGWQGKPERSGGVPALRGESRKSGGAPSCPQGEECLLPVRSTG